MKKIIILFVVFTIFITTSYAQVPTFQQYKLTLSPDAYPLLGAYPLGSEMNGQLLQLKPYQGNSIPLPAINDESTPGSLWIDAGDPNMIFHFNFPRNIDPGMLLTPKFWNCDPEIMLNSEKRIPTFRSFDPSELLNPRGVNSFVTPFLSPLTDPLLKEKELQSLDHLHFPE